MQQVDQRRLVARVRPFIRLLARADLLVTVWVLKRRSTGDAAVRRSRVAYYLAGITHKLAYIHVRLGASGERR